MSKNIMQGWTRKHRRMLASIRRDAAEVARRLNDVLAGDSTTMKATEVVRGIDEHIADADRKITAYLE